MATMQPSTGCRSISAIIPQRATALPSRVLGLRLQHTPSRRTLTPEPTQTSGALHLQASCCPAVAPAERRPGLSSSHAGHLPSHKLHPHAATSVVPTPTPLQSQQRRAVAASAALPQLWEAVAASPYRDGYCLLFAAIGAFIWVKMFDLLASNGLLEKKLSRKIVHTTTGPLFVLTWPLFSALPMARFLCCVVPCLNAVRLLAVGCGVVEDQGLVKSVSRSGERGELLRGPLYYCAVLIAATLLCWRDNPAGLVAVSLMCGGDGLADIVGRRLGTAASAKLPYNPSKSYAGSCAMFLGGLAMSFGLVQLFCSLGFFACINPTTLLPTLASISAVATIVESLPLNQVLDDNLSVPGVAWAMSLWLLPPAVMATAVAVVPLGMAL